MVMKKSRLHCACGLFIIFFLKLGKRILLSGAQSDGAPSLTCSSCTAPPALMGSLDDGTTLTLRSRGRAEPLDLGMLSGILFSWEMPVASSDPSTIWKQRRFLEPGGYFVVLQSRAPRQGCG